MLKIRTLPLGSYQTNCYIVCAEDSKTCAVIDPGYSPDVILNTAAKLGLTIDAILLTHGHFDHVGAVEQLVSATGCALWMHERDWSQFPNPVTSFYYPLANCDFTEVHFCEDGEHIHAGGLCFVAWETPGHTWGSVCYCCEDSLFTGDTLFAGSCGRIDLPGGDRSTMLSSLERLAEVEKDYRIYPGHGDSSTLKWEQKINPYLKGNL